MIKIPLKYLLGAFAVVSITGSDAIAQGYVNANKGFCQKTDNGYEICIKEENIICRKHPYNNKNECKASGISTDLVGEEKHWINSGDYNSDWNNCTYKNPPITCIAARHFGKLNF